MSLLTPTSTREPSPEPLDTGLTPADVQSALAREIRGVSKIVEDMHKNVFTVLSATRDPYTALCAQKNGMQPAASNKTYQPSSIKENAMPISESQPNSAAAISFKDNQANALECMSKVTAATIHVYLELHEVTSRLSGITNFLDAAGGFSLRHC